METERKKRVTQKMIDSFIEKELQVLKFTKPGLSGLYYASKLDGSYVTHVGVVGNVDDLKWMIRKGFTQLQNKDNNPDHTANIAFVQSENKWYGWSHRAVYGFGIGSECKKGHVSYQPANKLDFKEDCLRFWGDLDMNGDTHKVNLTAEEGEQDGKQGVWVKYTYDNKVPNKKLRGQISGMFSEYPETFGKGEWVAETIEDAKQMAIDFAEGIS